jgi:hypothetical protein
MFLDILLRPEIVGKLGDIESRVTEFREPSLNAWWYKRINIPGKDT